MRALLSMALLTAAAVGQATPQVDGTTGTKSDYTTNPCSGPAWDPNFFTSDITAWDPQDPRDWEFQFKVNMEVDYTCGDPPTAWVIVTVTTNDSPENRAPNYVNVNNFFVYSDDVQYLVMLPMTYDNLGNNGEHQWHFDYAPDAVPAATTAVRFQGIVVGANTSMITEAHRVSWQ